MIITAVSSLDPRMEPLVERLLHRAAELGIPAVVTEARRELTTQMAYFSRGRAPVALVKAYFARCGLWAISDAEAQTASTDTLYSKHIDGLAVDVVLTKDGRSWWDAPLETWQKLWTIAEDECGLDACAGGKWQAWQKNGRPWDLPHIEYRAA